MAAPPIDPSNLHDILAGLHDPDTPPEIKKFAVKALTSALPHVIEEFLSIVLQAKNAGTQLQAMKYYFDLIGLNPANAGSNRMTAETIINNFMNGEDAEPVQKEGVAFEESPPIDDGPKYTQ